MQLGHGNIVNLNWERYLTCPEAKEKWGHIAKFLLQVHDSIVFETRHKHEAFIPDIVNDMRVIIPYPDPLIIPMSFAHSRISWGDCV
jgi:hypothetical protein